MAKNNGGAAFPEPPANYSESQGAIYGQAGMTMRQYYKAAALQGILAGWDSPNGCSFDPQAVTSRAVAVADAMIAEDEEAAKT